MKMPYSVQLCWRDEREYSLPELMDGNLHALL